MVARPWSSSRLSCGERLLLRCDGNAGNSFRTTQGKDHSSHASRRKRGHSGYGRDARVPLEWRQCRENRFPWNGLRHLGDSGIGDTTLEFLSPFLWRASPLEMRRERREFFPDHAGKGFLLSKRRKQGSSGCVRDSPASSRLETGMSGNFLSCSKGVKDPLEVPEVRCD